ncbi:MAG: multicomponent Na+:H+ antiporter subunit E [Gammaproteobacteria bacterium]|jgi:multicomponent Na+:H+ antiporter subunit E
MFNVPGARLIRASQTAHIPMRFALSFLFLFSFWWLLSGQTKPLLLGTGVVVCALVALLSTRMGLVDEESHPMSFIPKLVTYAPWLAWQVLQSNWDVTKRVWSPQLKVQPRFFSVPCDLKTEFGRATYANSITLTPGTVTVDTGDAFLIHALHQEAADSLATGDMERRVQRLEGSQ